VSRRKSSKPTSPAPTEPKPVASQSWHGPLPPPAALEHFERIVPGAAQRLIDMAEAEQKHRHSIEAGTLFTQQEAVRLTARDNLVGMVLGFLALASDPRVRGEGPFSGILKNPCVGRSPRARGRLRRGAHPASWRRSIPACAGKATANLLSQARGRVDPRVRGEGEARNPRTRAETGRSPRMRGRPLYHNPLIAIEYQFLKINQHWLPRAARG
jgi:hypothetical protein